MRLRQVRFFSTRCDISATSNHVELNHPVTKAEATAQAARSVANNSLVLITQRVYMTSIYKT